MSSSGVLVRLTDFAPDTSLRRQWIELSLEWPTEAGSVKLILLGRIARIDGQELGVKIIRYGFARELPQRKSA